MFDNDCPMCGTRVLIFPNRVTAISNTDHGIEVTFTCWCGTEQKFVTGRRRERFR